MLGGHDAHYIHIVWVIALAFGAAAIVALVVIYKRAARREELDEIDRMLDD